MVIGDKLYAKNAIVAAYAAYIPPINGQQARKYDAFAHLYQDSGEILNADNSEPDETVKLHLYLGDAVNGPERIPYKQWTENQCVGTFTGRTSGNFIQVNAVIWVYNPPVDKDSQKTVFKMWVLLSDLISETDAIAKAKDNKQLYLNYKSGLEYDGVDGVGKNTIIKTVVDTITTKKDPKTGSVDKPSGDNKINITTIIIVVFGFLGLIIGGVLFWKGRQNKLASEQSKTN